MSESWDALKRELQDNGVSDEWIGRIEASNAASPIRKERDDWKTKAETASGELGRYRAHLVGSHLAGNGWTGKADVLARILPDDLDPLDPSKVTEWAVDMGLIQPPAKTDEQQQIEQDLAAHDRMVTAGSATDPRPRNQQQRDEALTATNPAEFWEKAQQAGLVAPGVQPPKF